ncbi:MAG: hypothetical protein MUC36_26190, partial [Planctomycetes bacterium]|nr:hypothetical protein [Planctomycetota bacterium]
MNPQRQVHPTIAPLALPPGIAATRASPYVAIRDGIWNHGEGFAATAGLPDTGAWHGDDVGANVTAENVVLLPGAQWEPFTWNDDRVPPSPVTVMRLAGCLRRPSLSLPQWHPIYGDLSAPISPLGYIDQAAFEIFKPQVPPTPQQKIVICILCEATTRFPQQYDDRRPEWRNVYPGIFSPDGLVRRERFGANPPDATQFLANRDPYQVERPLQLSYYRAWYQQPQPQPFWPILAYSVLSVAGRQTTLNEQRHLQLLAAIKALLQETSERNPLQNGQPNFQGLTPQEIEQRVVVVFAGASNGGHQAHWSALRHPRTIHGSFSEVISPSIQRLYGEHDLGHALSRITGGPFSGATVTESDFLNWNQYCWSFGAECHDLSYPRLFTQKRTYRPAYFGVGDEDITSTGTDWKRLLGGSVTAESGEQSPPAGPSQVPSALVDSAHNTIAWAIAENGCHQTAVAPITDPYSGQPGVYEPDAIAMQLMAKAVAQRSVELGLGTLPPLVVVPTDRTASDADQFRGIDDPHEWHLGRGLDGPPSSPAVLQSDQVFFDAVQPDTAGANPGRREAMLIADQKVFVGSADGYVSAFQVDTTSSLAQRQRLVRTGQSVRLGNQAYAMAFLPPSSLVVGTRRHLYKLSMADLSVQQFVVLPWEVSQPHHMKVADVLPNHDGPEIVFASVHGGLVFYGTNLQPLFEWPEPGIHDFVIEAQHSATILSARGVVARVQFAANSSGSSPPWVASLVALSRSIPEDLRGPVETRCQGNPIDLELMRLDAIGITPVALWTGDDDGPAVRRYDPATMERIGMLSNFHRGAVDIASCSPDESNQQSAEGAGEHLLVLSGGSWLSLLDHTGSFIAEKDLDSSQQGYYPFGADAHTIAVGELVQDNPGSGTYSEEIVVATNTGLMWLHVNDLLLPGTALPASPAGGGSGYWLHMGAGASNSHAQPRTNQSLSCAWAMGRKPAPLLGGLDPFLHVVDQRGCYWKVSRDPGSPLPWRLHLESVASQIVGAPRTMSYYAVQASAWPFPSVPIYQSNAGVTLANWVPIDKDDVVYERSGSGRYLPNNWVSSLGGQQEVSGFWLHPLSGASLEGSPLILQDGSARTMWWSANGSWANSLEGIRSSLGIIDGVWTSTQPPSPLGGAPDRLSHWNLKSFVGYLPVMTQQSMKMVELPDGRVAVVLGCAGGRVRIVSNYVFEAIAAPQALGNLSSMSEDVGFGAAGLHAQLDPTGTKVVVWFGSCYSPPPLPTQYSQALPPALGNLADNEVAAGAVHRIEWTIASGTWGPLQSVPLTPAALARGAGAVGGLLMADVIDTLPGQELIVACLTGDVIVMDPRSLSVIGMTHFGGSVGHYNSMVVADLGGGEAIYIAGSLG